MSSYAFRLRLVMPPREKLGIDQTRLRLLGHKSEMLNLSSWRPADRLEMPIRDSNDLVITGKDFPSEKSAVDAGNYYRDILILTLARLRIGADMGLRYGSKGGLTHAGLAEFEKTMGNRVLNDVHGLMVFETNPSPQFIRSEANLTAITSQEVFERVFQAAIATDFALTDSERLAYDLFSASFFEGYEDARFLTLMMALEVLFKPADRGGEVRTHVKGLIEMTANASTLPSHDRESLLGSLGWLYKESIGQAGRRHSRERLGEREYMNMSAPDFFQHCYALRSTLTHGIEPFPTHEQVGPAVAQLETFVADILAGPLLTVDIEEAPENEQ